MKDRRLLFHVHGRKFYLAPPRRPGGPYYIRFEPPSNPGKRVRTVHRGDPDLHSSSILTGELIRQFERIRMVDAKTEPGRRRARASIRSYVVQARSLVAPRKMRFYENINLPDLTSFRNEKVEMPK